MDDDALADFASGDDQFFDRTQSLIAESQRRRRERDAEWAIHLENRMRVSAHGIALLREVAARLDLRNEQREDRGSV